MFERAAVARPGWGERIAIPFEGKSLHGYFFAAANSGRPAPTLLMTGGYDSTAEEAYFTAVRRRWRVVTTSFVMTDPARVRL